MPEQIEVVSETMAEVIAGQRCATRQEERRRLLEERLDEVVLQRAELRRDHALASLSTMLDASIANARGDTHRASAALSTCVELAKRADMSMHGAAAVRQLGALLGGERGKALITEADAAMAAEDILAPARWAAMLLPGRFGPQAGRID